MHWRRVDPYGLVFKMRSRRHIRTGVWYLVAYSHTCQEFRTFRVGHIEKLKVRQERIKAQKNFDLRAYWRKARRDLEEQAQPLTLMLRVTPSARQGLGGSYSILKEEADGSAIVSVDLESVDAAISYALGLGADATVLSPANVREAVAATAQAIAEMYTH
jgi:predicted DNA-binding transcriptional regulator YafY